MNPVLITPPVGEVVPLSLLRQHLRIDHTDEDLLLASQEAAAVAWLDGFTGILGRAILPQVWRQEVAGGDYLRLALPDVSAVVVTAKDAAGVYQPVASPTVIYDGSAAVVDLTGVASASVRVDYTCGMNIRQLAAAQIVVMLVVGNWYRSRESVVIGSAVAELPMAARSMIAALQWVKV